MDPVPNQPDLQRTAGSATFAQANTAPQQALASMGQAIGVGSQVMAQIQRTHDAGQLLEAENAYAKEMAAFEQEIIENPDLRGRPAEWLETWEKRSQQFQNGLKNQPMTAALRRSASARIGQLGARFGIRIARDGALQAIANTKEALSTRVQGLVDQGDYEGAKDVYAEMGPSAGYTDEQLEGLFQDMDKAETAENVTIDIESDPFSVNLDNYKLSPMQRLDAENHVERQQKKFQQNLMEGMRGGIATGDITTESELIEGAEGRLTPLQQATMRDYLGATNEKRVQGIQRSPEWQEGQAGRIHSMLDGVEFQEDPTQRDTAWEQIETAASMLTDSGLKKGVRERIDALRDISQGGGSSSASSSITGYVGERFKSLRESGVFGEAVRPEPRTAGNLLRDGFFEDKAKMKALGMTDEAIEALQGENDLSAKVAIFRDSFALRDRSNITASQFDQDLAESLADSGNLNAAIEGTEDPEALSRFNRDLETQQRAYGRAKTQMDQWLKRNPSASLEEVDKQLKSIIGGAQSEAASQSLLPSRSGYSFPVQSIDAKQINPRVSLTQPTASQRAQWAAQGGTTVSFDSNWLGGGRTPTKTKRIEIVLPNNPSPALRSGAERYVANLKEIHRNQFGRNLPTKVVTRGELGNGRAHTVHLEPFDIRDTSAVNWAMTPEGRQTYMAAVEDAFQGVPMVKYHIPHSPGKGAGAAFNGHSEESIAKWQLGGIR